MAQYMKCRNDKCAGPTTPRITSLDKLKHAEERGYAAYDKFNKPISDNPYKIGSSLAKSWETGYLRAAKWKPVAPPVTAGQGREVKPYGIVNVIKTSRKKFKIPGGYDPDRKEPPFNDYLGFIPERKGKPATFGRWTRNPPKPKEDEDVVPKNPEKNKE